jgi:NTE family protein
MPGMKTHSELFSAFLLKSLLLNLIIVLSLLFISTYTNAQSSERRPTIGLALSGGAAHGIAHIGVLKVMEESGIRPDYITGVSMGSIIGGMYSLGYSADSLTKILKKINWEALLSNKIPENKVIFIEKGHFNNSIISLPISFKEMKLPSGLIDGQLIENALSYYSWPAADINDFSKLPIPFMCLATDLISFKTIELKSGYLPDAIRASCSIPTVFTPIKIDTMLLVDGGMTRNFAPGEAKSMGADIVIGSYVGFYPYKESELQTVSGILKQIALFRSVEDFRENKKFVDVLITPNTKNIPLSEFQDIDSLVQRGYRAALPYKGYFKRLADSLNRLSPQKTVKNILDKQYYTFHKIEIEGNKSFSDHQILGVLNIKPYEKVDKNLITEGIDLLYGKSWFDKIKYRIVPRNDSLILVIDCMEKPQSMLFGSVHYDNDLLSGILIGMSVKNLLTQSSLINLNTYISQYYRVELNAIQFIDRNQKFGLSAHFMADNTLLPMIRLHGNNGSVVTRNYIEGLSINRMLGLNHMMNISVNYENRNLLPRYYSEEQLKDLSYNYITAEYEYCVNTLDAKHFPDKGIIANTSFRTAKLNSGSIKTDSYKTIINKENPGEFSFDRFYTLSSNIRQYFSPTRNITFSIGGDLLWISKSDSVSSQNNFFLLGGQSPLNRRSISAIGFHANQIPVKKVAGIRGEMDIELIKDLHLSLMANFFAVQEVNRNKGFSFIQGYGIGLGYMSVIGPIRIGIMRGQYNKEEYFRKTKGYISIGFNF